MKHLRPALALLIVAAFAAMAPAQTGSKYSRQSAAQALNSLQQDLVNAIQSMKSALPIYDGNRVKSIRAAHEALVLVDKAIYGAKAVKRQRPNVNEGANSHTTRSQYTAQQIEQSQASMRQGLQALQTAINHLQVAAGTSPNKQGQMVYTYLQTAVKEANTAIGIHSTQG